MERVLPEVPYRQWTLSFPKRLRWVLLRHRAALRLARNLFVRAVAAWQRRAAKRLGVQGVQTGALVFTQHFGSALQPTPHFHSLVPDGVWQVLDDGPRFVPLPPPTTEEVERLLASLARRLLRRLQRMGLLPADGPEDAREAYQAAALQQRFAWAELGLAKPPRKRPRVAFLEGFSLHADTHLHAHDRPGLERLLPLRRPRRPRPRASLRPSTTAASPTA